MGFSLNQLEQERQIRKLQKKEDKDTKDYEQLSNLPKVNNVELKGDKTTSDLGINADNVMMSDGVTNVEDAVDDIKSGLTNVESALAHDYAGSIDISSYNTIDNPYTLQWNGYVRINGTGSVMLLAQDNISISILQVANNNDLISVYVKKGSRIYVTASVALYIIMA